MKEQKGRGEMHTYSVLWVGHPCIELSLQGAASET